MQNRDKFAMYVLCFVYLIYFDPIGEVDLIVGLKQKLYFQNCADLLCTCDIVGNNLCWNFVAIIKI